jgi:hypothetical protein
MLGVRSGWPGHRLAQAGVSLLAGLTVTVASTALAASSTSSSTRWTPAALPGPVSARPSLGALVGISCRGAHCVAVGQDRQGQAAVALISGDGGRTWGTETSPSGAVALYGVSCISALRCWAVGKAGPKQGAIVATTNGGLSWHPETIPTVAILSTVSCSGKRRLASGDALGSDALVTQNGGGHWSIVTLARCHGQCVGYEISGVTFASSKVAYAGGGSQCGGKHLTQCPAALWKSTDGGLKWRMVYKGFPFVDAISCVDAQHCWAAAATFKTGVILGSASGGAHWRKQTLPRFGGYFNAISCVLAGGRDRCAAVGQNEQGTAPVIATTTNGGSSWRLDRTPAGIGALYGVDSSATLARAVGWTKGGAGPVALVS